MPDNSASWEDLAEFIRDAARQMREYGLTTIDVEHDGSRVRLKIGASRLVQVETVSGSTVIQPSAGRPPAADLSEQTIFSPMIGTFYASPSPGEPAFVEVGDPVEAGQVIGIIEAMKIMNEITAELDGTVTEILVKNAQAVEYGQPLFRISIAD